MPSIENHKSPNAALGIEDPEWTAFYAKRADEVPRLVGTPKELRDVMEQLKIRATSQVQPIKEGLVIKDVAVPSADGHSVPVRIYTPTNGDGPRTGLLYIHGGGWTLGDLEGEDIACRAMCVRGDVVVVSVDYRLAPENPFPAGLEDCWTSLLWLRDNAQSLGVDASSLILAGSSSGGNFTAVLAHRARDKGIELRGQILRIPSVCHIDVYPPELQLYSVEDLKDAPLLSKRSMELFYGYYAPRDPSHTDVSPLLNTNFKGLAPAYLQVAGLDPLRDEGLAYAEKLRQAGVPTKVDIYPGLPHAFGYFPALSAAAKNGKNLMAAIQEIKEGRLGK